MQKVGILDRVYIASRKLKPWSSPFIFIPARKKHEKDISNSNKEFQLYSISQWFEINQ